MKKIRVYIATVVAIVCSACVSEQKPIMDDVLQDSGMEKYMKISIDEAQQTLEEFMSLMGDNTSRNTGGLKISDRYSKVVGSLNSRSKNSDSSYIHIFNFENSEGFAIMSGDKRVCPVLAFVENGNLLENQEIANPGFAIFLEGLEDYYINSIISSPLASGLMESRGTVTRPTEITISNKANCKVKWNQSPAPYNNLCPLSNGQKTLAGCVPVACAQLMSVYAHPQKYSSSTYAWSEMTRSANGASCSSTAQSQIADLLFQLGKSGNLGVTYGVSGSGAKVDDIPGTLRNMGYSNGGRKCDYSEKDVVNEIGAGYPVIISGFRTKHEDKILGITINSSYRDGHAWIADGYAKFFKTVDVVDDNGRILSSTWYTTYYIRCNWGWGGQYDGYFLSGSFHPSANPSFPDNYNGRAEDYNYRYRVENVIGIRK